MNLPPPMPDTEIDTPAAAEQAHDRLHDGFRALRDALAGEIVGQAALVERLLTALLADGHLLVEGAPGLAKTTAIRALAARLEADFSRVQFTPDLLPADLTGTEIWRPQEGRFEFVPGPIFHPILLADEINRAPAKVQSALLEAMGERQVTVGRHTYALPALFLVMATQNPIEQEGTFPLPEAQLDRFLMHVRIGYPDSDAEAEILRLARERARDALGPPPPAPPRMPLEDVFAARKAVLSLHMAPALERYLIEIVLASRDAARYDPALARRIAWGASPRGSIALERCARARAWLAGRDFVTPDDVRSVAPDVLRHRVLPSYEATAEGWDGDRLVAELLARVPAP
ncbi:MULTISPECIES: MoxR family ATPase [unclassified Stenotrophomonas]|uniref:AAA family ATPase n=1 Tax=unclassified Stenotrophomonas TaxID=196198 RepID=UPI002117AF41|nr:MULTISPECIES: MoxR family ATPase [unclassified Stenotrophomonas]